MPNDTKSINGVEIFSVGTWNGDEYTQQDLNEMVRAFQETQENWKPPLKLGHTEDQAILQSDGMPAAGWIGNLYTKGGKLLADFIDMPSKIMELIESKGYRHVSSEIFWDAEVNGKKFKRMLAAVALLGVDMPAVTNLREILAIHAHAFSDLIKSYAIDTDALSIKSYTFNPGGLTMPKTEAEIKLEFDLKLEQEKALTLSTQIKTYENTIESNKSLISNKDKEIEELKTYRLNAEAKAVADEKALIESNLEKSLTELQSEKMITPSMRPYVKALLSEEKKEYSLKVKDKDEKFSKAELLKHILKLYTAASSVNFEENSEDNKVKGSAIGDEKVLNEQIEQYAKEHKVSYSAAYKAVTKKTA